MSITEYMNSFPSVTIPCIHDWNSNITPAYIGSVFANLEIGIVRNVVLIPIKPNRGNSNFKAVIYFQKWFNNPAANNIRNKIIDRHRAKIVYNDPHTWVLLPSKREEYLSENNCSDKFNMYFEDDSYINNDDYVHRIQNASESFLHTKIPLEIIRRNIKFDIVNHLYTFISNNILPYYSSYSPMVIYNMIKSTAENMKNKYIFEENPPVTPEQNHTFKSPPKIVNRSNIQNLEHGEVNDYEAEYNLYGDDSDYLL